MPTGIGIPERVITGIAVSVKVQGVGRIRDEGIWLIKGYYTRGYDVPAPEIYGWLKVVTPRNVPSEWLTLDLGAGELETMALALENPDRVVILDDALARRIAQAAGLQVWGTLKVLLEAKAIGLTEKILPQVDKLAEAGMWISDEVRQRVLALAGE